MKLPRRQRTFLVRSAAAIDGVVAQAVNLLQLIETRCFKSSRIRGKAPGQANKRPQVWHLSGPRSDE